MDIYSQRIVAGFWTGLEKSNMAADGRDSIYQNDYKEKFTSRCRWRGRIVASA
jgi:hypothetical protein